jgi:hypothetical protein
VNLTKASRYALLAALEMAEAGERPVTAADVARRHGAPEAVVAKVLAAPGARRPGRGNPRQQRRLPPGAQPSSGHGLDVLRGASSQSWRRGPKEPGTPLDRLMAEVTDGARYTFASVSLETLSRSPAVLKLVFLQLQDLHLALGLRAGAGSPASGTK